MTTSKAQSALEYLMIVALTMGIIIPAVYLFFQYSSESSAKIINAQINQIGRNIIDTAETVYFSGKGSKIALDLNMPENVIDIYILANRELIFNINSEIGETEVVFFSSANIPITSDDSSNDCVNGIKCALSGIAGSGLKKIKIENGGSGVVVSIFGQSATTTTTTTTTPTTTTTSTTTTTTTTTTVPATTTTTTTTTTTLPCSFQTVTKGTANNNIPFYGGGSNAMRLQTLYLQSEINKAGYIDKIYFQKGDGVTGTFNNFKIYLCHSNLNSLTDTFDDNCKDAPVKVGDVLISITISGAIDSWIEFDVDNTFTYNNLDNLIVEVRWNGDNGNNVPLKSWADSSNRRLFATSDTATTGAADIYGYNFRAYIC